jgi:hypothetical protein
MNILYIIMVMLLAGITTTIHTVMLDFFPKYPLSIISIIATCLFFICVKIGENYDI